MHFHDTTANFTFSTSIGYRLDTGKNGIIPYSSCSYIYEPPVAKILVAEDDYELAGLLADWLAFEKHDVVLTHDGGEAEAALAEPGIELLILDWELPTKSGIDICRTHRSKGGILPIIMLTARVSIDSKAEGFDAGADDYLTKPFHMKELSGRIQALLRRSKPHTVTIAFKVCTECGVVFSSEEKCADCGSALKDDKVEISGAGGLLESYDIERVLGRGSMSIVFLARQKSSGRRVALKLMDVGQAQDEVSFLRFQQEARLLNKLHHPNIVGVHDFGHAHGGQPFIAMDFVDGIPLSRCIARKEKFSAARATNIFKQLAQGIAHAHDRSIIHRDLKPANLILEKFPHTERVNIVDFGVAKVVELDQETTEESKLTRSGEIFGTTAYMSPEQCMGREPDNRADIYSIGCIMYEVISGAPPFSGRNVLETIHQHIHKEPAPLVSACGDLPEILEKAVMKALAKEPMRRFQSAHDIITLLDRMK